MNTVVKKFAALLPIAGLMLAVWASPAHADKPKGAAKEKGRLRLPPLPLDEELKKVGQISPQEFAKQFALKSKYTEKLSFDPTAAKFYDGFDKDSGEDSQSLGFRFPPQQRRVGGRSGRTASSSANAWEQAVSPSSFYRIYSRDLPVYIFVRRAGCTHGIAVTMPCSKNWKKPISPSRSKRFSQR